MIRSNIQKQEILKVWRTLLWDFSKRELLSVFLWSGLGAITAGLIHLMLWDRTFQEFLNSKYIPVAKLLDNPHLYLPYLISAAVLIVFGVALRIPDFLLRFIRSWLAGVTSGLAFLSFTSVLIAFVTPFFSIQSRVLIACALLGIFFSASFLLYLLARVQAVEIPSEDDLRVSSHMRSVIRTQWSESDDPIRTWAEDAIGRAALVDSITVKLMISKSPVLALFGELGCGKTSTLNLLREHLVDKAIVVFFSTWLPGSQETFIAYLLNDIANECQKHYVVPGLRKSAQRLVKALGQNVPFLRSYLELLPASTQRDDITSIHTALMRLPKRVVVLLDELDRMEKEELVTLLKVIRGISHLPNLSFVCAGDFQTIVKTVKSDFTEKSIVYFEKFFFDVVNIPQLDPTEMQRAGSERLAATLSRRNWFNNTTEKENFRKQIGAVWEELIAPFCRNLRAIGVLANAVGAAAAPLVREVHPVDLTLLELIRRFRPQIYTIIARNSVTLTGGPRMLRGGAYHTDKEKEELKKKLLADLQAATPDEDLQAMKGLLGEMFPLFKKIDNQSSWSASRVKEPKDDDEDQKRIRQPEMFPAYFRYELPEAIFPSVEMDAFLRKMDGAAKADVERCFVAMLDSMEKGSLKRDDFLRKLAQAALKSIKIPTGINLVHAAMKAAHKYTYDMFVAFGEAGHVIRLVIRIAERLPAVSDRLGLLDDSILSATDDTMALNILTRLTGPHDDFNLEISQAQLHPAFIKRMRERYGRHVDPLSVDLSTADPWAFYYWGHEAKDKDITIDPEDRAIQRDFWLKHIGNSRSRLAQDFRQFFMPASVRYSDDVAPFVENKIPLVDLKRLHDGLVDDGTLSKVDRQSLKTLQRLLEGEFKNGAGFEPYHYRDEDAATA
jgi:predicted KAP-like P-loop ATPase